VIATQIYGASSREICKIFKSSTWITSPLINAANKRKQNNKQTNKNKE